VLSVTQLIVHVADLCEAEGRVLRAMAVRLALGVAILFVAILLATGGVTLLLAAIYIAIQGSAGAAVAALVTGAIALGIGGTLVWLGRRIAT
jgi:hypothetical protein